MLREDILHELARVFDATGNDLIGAALAQITVDGERLEELERLRACLENTRDEICEGPVDDVLWHTAVPACTTVDNITLALRDGWTYDGWLQAKEEQV